MDQVKAPIFLEAISDIEITQEPQSILEVNSSILKVIFPQEQTHPFKSICKFGSFKNPFATITR